MLHQIQSERRNMTRLQSSTTALALVFAAATARADVTPEEVWQSWQSMATSAGQELSFDSAMRTGDKLAVSGLIMTYTDAMGGSFSANLDTLTFTDKGDGTVAVTMAETYPMTFAFPSDGEGLTALKLTISQPGVVITAGGSATETKYDFDAPTVAVTMDEALGADGKPLESKAEMRMTALAASYVVQTEAEKIALDSSFSAGSLELSLTGKGLDGNGEGTVSLTLADLTGATKGNFLGAEVMKDMAVALNAGFSTESSFSFGPMTLAADITDASGPVKLAGALTGGKFDLSLDKDRLNYATGVTGGSFTVSGPEIPFPEVAFGFAESSFGLLMPVSKSDTPQDFAFVTKLVDLTMSEDIWGLLDPAATLPRDPASFVLDVNGSGILKQDIMDPALQAEGAQPDGALVALNLTQVLVKGVGAEIGATGALTFDTAGQVTFQGSPAPTGKVDVSIRGANGLIDNLIAMGLFPSEQAMGARMMLGLFARPGGEVDQLTSVIEFKDGQVFANGQQLPQ
jgi:hypothetical protein